MSEKRNGLRNPNVYKTTSPTLQKQYNQEKANQDILKKIWLRKIEKEFRKSSELVPFTRFIDDDIMGLVKMIKSIGALATTSLLMSHMNANLSNNIEDENNNIIDENIL